MLCSELAAAYLRRVNSHFSSYGHLSSLVACHCTDLYLFNLFVHLANKLSLSLSLSLSPSSRIIAHA